MNEQAIVDRKNEREEIRKTSRQLKIDQQRQSEIAAHWGDPEEQIKELETQTRELERFRD